MILPPVPKWNKTTDDLDTKDYKKRVRDYERSLLPPGIVFPRTGQVWETVHDCEVFFKAWFAKTPATDGKARLAQGERVRILTVDDPKPLWVHFEPVRYQDLQESIVPHDLRSAPDYDHYELYAGMARIACWLDKETIYFNELLRLVDNVA